MTRQEELQHKQDLVRRYLADHKLDALLLSSRSSFAWFTAGGDNHVLTVSEHGVGTLFITPRKAAIITNNIEAPRLMQEEAPARLFEYHFTPWHDEAAAARLVRKLITRKRTASDDGTPGTVPLPGSFEALRYSLLPPEVSRYRRLGRWAGEAIETAARSIRPGMSEFEIAARLDAEVVSRGMETTVNLIAVDERIKKYRHPIPTDKKLKRHSMIVLGARKWGLIISCTRLVHFGPLPAALARKHRAVCRVDAALNLSSVPGACVGDVFRVGLAMYKETGFADQWQLHHQGGPTGYGARDYKGTSTETRCIQPFQALAWNPSITGTKSEDTVLATPRGVQFLSAPIDWPTLEVEVHGATLRRADILVL